MQKYMYQLARRLKQNYVEKEVKKILRVKKHRSASKPLHNCSNRCDVSFCNNYHAYMYLYFCMRWWLQLFCSQLQILERRNFVSWKRNFVSSKRYFVSPKRNFSSSKRNTKFRPTDTKLRNEISPHAAKFRFD